ncbi:MAG: Mor transcription activator family protein [Sulfuriferula sp.]
MSELLAVDLPGTLRDIAALIGLPGTLKLVETYGGVRLYVPKRLDAEHELARLLGLEHAAKLAATYGGELHFDIPRAVAATRAARNRCIKADRASGSTHRQLALANSLTERQIRTILGEEAEDDRQELLF